VNAISYESHDGFGLTPPVGTTVVNGRRHNAVGVVKSRPFLSTFPSGGRRLLVWVDYSDSCGIVAIDDVSELEAVGEPGAAGG